jgi:plastocyanin
MKTRTRELTGCFMVALGLAFVGSCGGDDTSATGPAGSAGSGTAGSGAAGAGGSAGSIGSGGSGGGGVMLNGCDSSAATDKTASASTTVTFDDTLVYTPPCIRIKAGSSVTFMGDFMLHPLQGGTITGSTRRPDATSPIKLTMGGGDGGMSASFTFPAAGDFGYYCTLHGGIGMKGAVFVVP